MLKFIVDFPQFVASSGVSENQFCSELLAASNFRFPNFGELQEEMEKHPEYIDGWIGYSVDRRSVPSYFLRNLGSEYEVGFSSGEGGDVIGAFDRGSVACALFITLELTPRFLRLNTTDQNEKA